MSFEPTGASAVNPQPLSDRATPRLPPTAAPALSRDGSLSELRRTARDAPVLTDVALVDWSTLMSAVKDRLERLAAEPAPSSRSSPMSQALMAENVRQCVAALDQLQATLVRELARRSRLELEVFDLQTGLSQAHAELAGTRAGEQQARHLALHDGLTALPNRRHFRDRLDLALGRPLSKQSPLALLFLDLDGFKQINDRFGHAVGDDLLRIVANRLSRSLRDEDMVCRWGGDEFAGLLLGYIDPASLAQLAQKLFIAVAAPMQIGAFQLSIRPSIGLAVAPADGTTAEVLLQHADAAMYRAKRCGGGHAFYAAAPSTEPGVSSR